jgi:hypothetical protein
MAADEWRLRASRGGGGTVGVIVELRIKIYPLEKVHLSPLGLRISRFDKAEAYTLNRF